MSKSKTGSKGGSVKVPAAVLETDTGETLRAVPATEVKPEVNPAAAPEGEKRKGGRTEDQSGWTNDKVTSGREAVRRAVRAVGDDKATVIGWVRENCPNTPVTDSLGVTLSQVRKELGLSGSVGAPRSPRSAPAASVQSSDPTLADIKNARALCGELGMTAPKLGELVKKLSGFGSLVKLGACLDFLTEIEAE